MASTFCRLELLLLAFQSFVQSTMDYDPWQTAPKGHPSQSLLGQSSWTPEWLLQSSVGSAKAK